ncbi:pilus biogenesis protein [Betaproteobacteria bacterium]|nr:pilus biogenesis protein [Betaproteobacteria bacterium]GHU46541.1 pilus biogenesis protein [Betaproteobacteria bacterium]
METLLVDTGPLVALVSRRDHHHAASVARLKAYRGRLLTTWSVLTEFSHLCASVEASLQVYHWIESGGLELLPLGRDELVATIDWIERYADLPMDLADASLVIAALKTGCTRIWTLDKRDFETYRLPGRKRFDLV